MQVGVGLGAPEGELASGSPPPRPSGPAHRLPSASQPRQEPSTQSAPRWGGRGGRGEAERAGKDRGREGVWKGGCGGAVPLAACGGRRPGVPSPAELERRWCGRGASAELLEEVGLRSPQGILRGISSRGPGSIESA